jgi:hypothetical protein
MRRHAFTIRTTCLVAACLGMLAFRTFVDDPVAVIVQISGDVQLQRAGETRRAPADVGAALQPGDRVVVANGAKAVILHRTGRMETATAPVTIAAPDAPESGTLYTRTLRTVTQVATTDVRNQPNRQGMIRPLPGLAAPIAPRNGVAVLDVRPRFVWFAAPEPSTYTVQLRRTDVGGAAPQRFEVRADTVWQYPADAPPLVPGATYDWTVAVGGRVAQVQRFRTAPAETYADISATQARLATDGVDATTDGLFLLAMLYRDAGLYYEADAALRRIAAAGNGNGRFFHMLHAEVLDALGDLDGAAAAFQAADRIGAR